MTAFKGKAVPLLLIVLFALAVWTPQYVLRGFWEPDEPRYTYVAWEMQKTGNYFTPQRNGEFYAHKPPLMFWLIQASTLLTGGQFNGIAGRLPTLLGIIMALWAFSRIAAMWYPRGETAWWAMFILSTSFLFWHKAGTGQIDMLLLGLEMCALYFLFKNDATPDVKYSFAAFSFMGLGILAKGPVGLIVPCGIYLSAGLLSGQGRTVLKKQWVWGVPLALIFPLTWLLLAKITGAPGAYFNELIFDQNLGRVQGSFGGHYKPIYYYIQYLIIDFMPWTFFMPLAGVLLARNTGLKPQTRRLVGWILFVVIFFSLCGGKRNLYILSVYPAASLLLASVLPSMAVVSERWKKWSVYPVLGAFFILGSGLFIALFLPLPVPRSLIAGGSALLFVGAALLYRLQRYVPLEKVWFGLFIAFLVFLEFYIGTAVFPALNAIKTPAVTSRHIASVLPENKPILYYGMNGEIISLYSGRQGERVDDVFLLMSAMENAQKGVLVFSMDDYDILEPYIKELGTIAMFSFGRKELAWMAYTMPSITDVEISSQKY